MFTVVNGMTQDEVDELTPTDNSLSLLEVNSGPVIKELLQNHLKSKGCMAYLQPGMCNSLKSLIIATTTHPTSVYSTVALRKWGRTFPKKT